MQQKDTVERGLVQRVERGWILHNLGKVLRDGPLYLVESTKGNTVYHVDLDRDTCTCKDWRRRQQPCKHIFSAVIFNAKS